MDIAREKEILTNQSGGADAPAELKAGCILLHSFFEGEALPPPFVVACIDRLVALGASAILLGIGSIKEIVEGSGVGLGSDFICTCLFSDLDPFDVEGTTCKRAHI
jgi:hypothetical protein